LLLGIPYIPVLIGLFGLTEVFLVLSEPTPYVIPQKIGRVFPSLKEFAKYWKSIIRSSVAGLLTGIIPGAGANVATFVSYGIGERFTGRKFSKGDMEGVVCSEVANNANIGGALLPSLVLGIPGSATAAAFLAALNLHGIILGPTIEVEQPGIMYFMYGTLILANIAMYICAFALIKPSVKLFSLPREILLPVITLLCVMGSFAQKMAMFDIYLMFGFGLLGFFMRKADIPIGPLVLGVILGNMLDQNFRRAMVVFERESIWNVLYDRPVGTVLIVVVLLTFIGSIMPRKKKKKE
jgi:putative tricarboxylic transport membrane protein